MESRVAVSRTCDLPYDGIAQLLQHDASRTLRRGPSTGASRRATAVVQLHTRWAGFDHDEIIRATIGRYEPVDTNRGCLTLSWHAEHHRHLIPDIDGRLEITHLSTTTSEIHYSGHYQAPLGILGHLEDTTIGHRLIEDVINQLLDEIITHLRQHLTT